MRTELNANQLKLIQQAPIVPMYLAIMGLSPSTYRRFVDTYSHVIATTNTNSHSYPLFTPLQLVQNAGGVIRCSDRGLPLSVTGMGYLSEFGEMVEGNNIPCSEALCVNRSADIQSLSLGKIQHLHNTLITDLIAAADDSPYTPATSKAEKLYNEMPAEGRTLLAYVLLASEQGLSLKDARDTYHKLSNREVPPSISTSDLRHICITLLGALYGQVTWTAYWRQDNHMVPFTSRGKERLQQLQQGVHLTEEESETIEERDLSVPPVHAQLSPDGDDLIRRTYNTTTNE